MNSKKAVGIGIGGLVALVLVWFGVAAASVASEASRTDSMLKAALAQHQTQTEIDAKLRSMGFEVADTPTSSTGKGPNHLVVFYRTHLTVDLTFDPAGRNTGYHLDRA